MVEEMGVRVEIAEGASANLQGALDAGMGDGNVPEIFDFFMT
jgi:3-hydroxyisobutyrate dehydrogenase